MDKSQHISNVDIRLHFHIIRKIGLDMDKRHIPFALLGKYQILFEVATIPWLSMPRGLFHKLYSELLPQLKQVEALLDKEEEKQHHSYQGITHDYNQFWDCTSGIPRITFQKPKSKE